MSNKGKKQAITNRKIPPKKSKTAKNRSWTAPTVIGIIISVAGLVSLVELRPQLEIEPLLETVESQPYSVPFRIRNTGYLTLEIRQHYCYVSEASYPKNDVYTGGNIVSPPSGEPSTWLERQGSATVFCRFLKYPSLPTKADLVEIVDYRTWLIPHTFRHYVRFVGDSGKEWQWLEQPVDDAMRRTIDEQIDKGAEKAAP